MKRRAFLLRFRECGGMYYPCDEKLHQMATEFAAVNLADKVNFADYRKVWVAAIVDDNDNPVEIRGVIAVQYAVDIPVFRFVDGASCKMLVDRANDHLHDEGLRGASVFVYIADNEEPEQRCPNYKEWLSAWNCKPAERFLYKIR